MELADQEREDFPRRMNNLRSMLEKGIEEKIEEVQFNGHPEKRLPNMSNVSFKFIDGESLLLSLDMEGIAASTGSACASGSDEPAHALLAMGIPPDVARNSIRFTLGKETTEDEVKRVLEVLPPIVKRLREIAPKYNK